MIPTLPRLSLLQADLANDLAAFAPELLLCTAIVLMLVARLFQSFARVHLGIFAIAAVAAAFGLVADQWNDFAGNPTGRDGFSHLVRFDPYACFLRGFLLAAVFLVLLLGRITGLPDAADSGDFCVLLLGGTVGMMLMASANHLLTAFLAIEMASLPGYALAGFLKGRKQGSEAALKYVLYGAAASGVMLYGISLLAGRFGTGAYPALARGYAEVFSHGGFDLPLAAGTLLLFVGLGFKLSIVPFHFWLPDVFDGAAAEVGAMLSVASKGAAVGLTGRLLLTLQHAMPDPAALPETLGLTLAVFGAATATFGNLAAFGQDQIKRLLAYSTIAHAGYLLLGLATLSLHGVAASLVYLVAYLFANLGAFSIAAIVRTRTGREDLDAFRGLIGRSPLLGVAFAAFLLSLLGLPPLAGFAGKFPVFAALYEAGRGSEHAALWRILFAVAVLNTVVSAGYYLRVLKTAVLDAADEQDKRGDPAALGESLAAQGLVLVLLAATVVTGIVWNPLTAAAMRAVRGAGSI